MPSVAGELMAMMSGDWKKEVVEAEVFWLALHLARSSIVFSSLITLLVMHGRCSRYNTFMVAYIPHTDILECVVCTLTVQFSRIMAKRKNSSTCYMYIYTCSV